MAQFADSIEIQHEIHSFYNLYYCREIYHSKIPIINYTLRLYNYRHKSLIDSSFRGSRSVTIDYDQRYNID